MQEDGQVYMQLGDPGSHDTLEDRMNLIEAELAEKRALVEERFTRSMERHYEDIDA